MNDVLGKFSRNVLNSFLKDESKNKLTRHRKIYNLKLEYLNQYKPSLRSLREAYLKIEQQIRNRSNEEPDDSLGKTFIVHKQSVSTNYVEKKLLRSESPSKISKDSFHFFEVPNSEKKRNKCRENVKRFNDLRVFSKNSLISPKQAYVDSPKVSKADMMFLNKRKKLETYRQAPDVKKVEARKIKRLSPNIVLPVQVGKQLKRISELTIKGWDKYPSIDNFPMNSDSN